MENLSRFYDKIPGSYIAYIGFIFSVIFISIAVILYGDPTFSIFTHYLSDLGAVARNSSLVFNIGMIISAPIRVLFGFYLLKFLKSKGANEKTVKMTTYTIVIGAIGSVILALFPYDVLLTMHMLGAFVYFFSVIIIQISISKMELKAENMPKYLPIIGLIVVMNYVLFLVFEISEIISEIFRFLACFFEWMSYFSLMAWLVLHGYYIHRVN